MTDSYVLPTPDAIRQLSVTDKSMDIIGTDTLPTRTYQGTDSMGFSEMLQNQEH